MAICLGVNSVISHRLRESVKKTLTMRVAHIPPAVALSEVSSLFGPNQPTWLETSIFPGFSSNLFYQFLISRPNNKIHIREETSQPSDHSQPGTLVGWCYVCCDQHWDCPWNLSKWRKVTENIRVVFSWGGGIRMDWISLYIYLYCLWVQLV